MNCFGWISFDVGWFLVYVDVIDVECIFINVVVFFVEVWNIKWIFGDIVIIVDIVFRLKINNFVCVLDDSFGRWIGFKIVWIFIVYIIIFMN